MSTESVCRICVENTRCYESLFDSNGQKSDVYLLVVKYFDETIINFERAQHLKGICVNCLQKIQFFDHFTKSVISAQEKLEEHNEVKRENTLTGYDEELSLFHINDKFKHDLPDEEKKCSNQFNNDGVCVRPEESEHIKVPKLEIVDALSGDESIPSNHEKFLNSSPSVCSFSDDRNQNIAQNESCIEKSDETNPVNKLKNKIRSTEDIDDYIAKLLPSVECGMCKENLPTFTHLLQHFISEHPAKECYAVCCGKKFKKRSGLASHVNRMHSATNAYPFKHCIAKSDETNPINKPKYRNRTPKDIDINIAKLLPGVECGMCKEKIPTFTGLLQHFQSEHPAKKCYALCCGTMFQTRYMLARHVENSHSGASVYSCKYCKKSFMLRKSLLLHMMAHKPKKPPRSPEDIDDYIAKILPSVECGMCKEKQPTFTHLLQHFNSEHPTMECYAMCCGTMLKKRCELAKHVTKVHSGPSAYSCKHCNKPFLMRKNLILHMRKHKQNDSLINEKPDESNPVDKQKRSPEDIDNFISTLLPSVQCGMCKEMLATFTHLVQHFNSEHPAKECSALCCGKRFKKRSTLANHARTLHSGPNDYTCKLCNKSFLLRKSLSLHMHAHKPMKRQQAPKRSPEDIDNFISKLLPRVQCGMCKEKLPTYTHLALHFLSEHPEKECYAMCCGKTFKSRCNLAGHVSSSHSALKMDAAIAQLRPSLECVVCKETCSTYSLVQYHFESKHPFDEFYIMCCNRKLKDRPKLLEHLQFHENPNAFKCDVCNISFAQRQCLLRHMRTYHPTANVEFPKHITDPIKTSDCNNDAVCVHSEENKNIEMPKLEIVDAFSGDESMQSYHEEYLDSTLSAPSVHSGLSESFSDYSIQNIHQHDSNIDQHDSSSMEKADVNKVKNKMTPKRSAEDIDNNIAKILPNVECVMCKEKQPTFTHLLQHFKSEHPAKECYAICCGKKFKKRSCLASHVNRVHSGTNAYPWKHCNKLFLSRKNLLLHKRTDHPKRSRKDIDDDIAKLLPSVECGVCKEKQPTFTHLALHFTAEHPARECYTICCGTMFKKRSYLADHVNRLHSSPYAASCKTSARTADAAIAQLRPSLECVVCKETCTTFSLLQCHFESKHPLDEFYIMCCKRKLKDRSHLHQHLQFHENPNAFECNVCNKPFAERSSLLRHMRVCHHMSNVEIPKRINSRRKTSECNNDAVCVGSDEGKHIEVLNLEIV